MAGMHDLRLPNLNTDTLSFQAQHTEEEEKKSHFKIDCLLTKYGEGVTVCNVGSDFRRIKNG
jgi:hypothetical protein